MYDFIPPSDDFDYLRANGSITVSIDRRYNIPVFDLRFDGWYENSALSLAKAYWAKWIIIW